jgi:putative ABC transport system permease protein
MRYWLDSVSLDARLGGRMLVKHRWLTLVGGFAMAVAIAIGAIAFEVIGELINPALPFPNGDRVVAVRYVATKTGGMDNRLTRVFSDWRDRVTTLEAVGAYTPVQQNLVAPNVPPEPIRVVEMSSSAFDLAQVAPTLGRYLQPQDERAGAPPVMVIGYDAWRSRFNGDPQIIGRDIQLGATRHTVVGVAARNFRFPFSDQFWTPLRLDPVEHGAWQGPSLQLFARLKAGVSIEQAQAEVDAAGRATADLHPEGPNQLRARIIPFTRASADLMEHTVVRILRVAQLLIGALSLVVAVNLAILLYARTVTRLGEIAVRTALGASRRRILSQLFLEALALTGLGAVAGLTFAFVVLAHIQTLAVRFPFWVHFELSGGSILYGVALAICAAMVMGVLPGLKVTGTRLSANLQELNGRAATRLGSGWTALVVSQIAVAAAVLPATAFVSWRVMKAHLTVPTIATEQFAVANMVIPGLPVSDGVGFDREHVRSRLLAVVGRLREEAGVTGVTFSSGVPGLPADRRIQAFGETPLPDGRKPVVASFEVEDRMLATYGVPVIAGRLFTATDTGSTAVVVNRTFAMNVLGVRAEAALGSRFQFEGQKEWREVVGVVEDFPGFPNPNIEWEPTVYQPAAPGDFSRPVLTMRYGGPVPTGFAERMRAIAARVDPAIQIQNAVPLSSFYDELRVMWRNMAWAIGLVTLSVLLLSAAGIHALMSFTIAQRTREIGIRLALGAQPRQLLVGLFGRAMRQVAIGLVVGSVLSIGVFTAAGIGARPAGAMLLVVAVVMTLVATLAALGPARRSLRMPTVDALRVEG